MILRPMFGTFLIRMDGRGRRFPTLARRRGWVYFIHAESESKKAELGSGLSLTSFTEQSVLTE